MGTQLFNPALVMFQIEYFSHVGPKRSSPFYNTSFCFENKKNCLLENADEGQASKVKSFTIHGIKENCHCGLGSQKFGRVPGLILARKGLQSPP